MEGNEESRQRGDEDKTQVRRRSDPNPTSSVHVLRRQAVEPRKEEKEGEGGEESEVEDEAEVGAEDEGSRGQGRGRGRGGKRMPREGHGRGVSAKMTTETAALGRSGSYAWDRAPRRLPGMELSMTPAWGVDQTMVGLVGHPDQGSK